MNEKQFIGKLGENKAEKYLKDNGYIIIDKNYYCRFGEIDIVATDLETGEIVFIEVKTRTNLSFGMPIDSINYSKIKHLIKTINYYIIDKKIYRNNIRVDAIEVLVRARKHCINHIKRIIQ